MARYSKIRKMDIANGPGMRVSIFFQGCHFQCKGCFNKETWNENGGEEYTDKVKKRVLRYVADEHILGLTILGGEPLLKSNIESVIDLASSVRDMGKTVWLYTGYELEQVPQEVLDNVDVIVTGRFVEELKDKDLKWRGSSNQIITKL